MHIFMSYGMIHSMKFVLRKRNIHNSDFDDPRTSMCIERALRWLKYLNDGGRQYIDEEDIIYQIKEFY